MSGVDDHVKALETEIGLPAGFYDRLRKEDDWSFVIKLHAIFESATTYVLVKHIGNDALDDVFANLEMSNRKTGKVAFGKVLGLFDASERRFVYSLSELRNLLVHRASNVSFEFKTYIAGLNAEQKANFVNAFAYGLVDPVSFKDITVDRATFVTENPKFSIWLTGLFCLGALYLQKETVQMRHARQRAAIEFMESMTRGLVAPAGGAS